MSLKKNTLLLAIANGIVLLTNLFQTMVASRLVAQKDDFGALQQVVLITGLLVAFMASFPAALNYFSGLYERSATTTAMLVRRFSFAGFAGSALVALVLLALVPRLGSLFTNSLIVTHRYELCLLVFLRLFNTLYPNLCLVAGKLRRLIAINLVQCGLVFSLFLFRDAGGHVPVTLLLGMLVLAELLETGVMLFFLLPYFSPAAIASSRLLPAGNEWKYVLYLVTNGAVLALTTQVDRLIISSGANPGVYSDYSLGTFSNPLVGVLLASMATAFVPVLSGLYARQDTPAIFALWKKATGYAAALVLPIIFFSIFFGKDIIVFLFTGRYNTAGMLFQLYNCRFLFVFMLFSVTMNAVGLEKYTVVNSLINLVNTAVWVFAGWKWLGAEGAVLGTIVAIYLGYIYPVYIIRCKLGGTIRDYFPVKIFFRCGIVYAVAAGICLALRNALRLEPSRVILVLAPLYYLACLLAAGRWIVPFDRSEIKLKKMFS